jgi:hypothetical protein
MNAVDSPVPNPQSVAFADSALWITSAKTQRIYEADPRTLRVGRELIPPGEAFGLTFARGDLHAVLGFGNDGDDRFVYRLRGETFEKVFACPDLSGSFLGADDATIYLTQAHDKKLVTLTYEGGVFNVIDLARRPVGVTVANGVFFLVTADDDWKNRELARIEPASGTLTTVVKFDFPARGLAYDGEKFWTTHREASELVRFEA